MYNSSHRYSHHFNVPFETLRVLVEDSRRSLQNFKSIVLWFYLRDLLNITMYNYLVTPWCRVLLEKLTGLQLVKKFPAFHGGSLPHSQAPATCPYPGPAQSCPYTRNCTGDKIEKNEMGWACGAYGWGEGCIGSWWGNRRERDHWGDLGVDGWIILGNITTYMLQKYFNWL